MLDILNTHYPALIQNRTDCLLCSSTSESNVHFWSCPIFLPLIRTSFATLASKLEDILIEYGNQLTWSIKDSIAFSPVFAWILRPGPQDDNSLSLEALLLLKSYVPTSLYRIFQMHYSKKCLALNVLLVFMQTSLVKFKSSLWKFCSIKWK